MKQTNWIQMLNDKPKMAFGLQMQCRELDIFKISGIFWEIDRKFFGFFGNFFGGFFWGRTFFGGFFGRNYLVEINKELKFLSRFWGNFVSMEKKKEGRILILRRAIASTSHFKKKMNGPSKKLSTHCTLTYRTNNTLLDHHLF